mmetsp:Transcript_93714/g.205122  ORF Transcript_93714/g.205122 Transcript_93714/m.205122 type:complete len:666 (-) Transcript_93714:251-2248(-)
MPAGYGSTLVKQKPLLLGLICLTILYQFIYHNIVVQTFEDGKSEEEAQCAAEGLQATPRCVELRLFQDWRRSSSSTSSSDFGKAIEVEVKTTARVLEAEAAAHTTPTEVPSSNRDTERRLEEGVAGATDPSTTSWTSMALWAQGLQELEESAHAAVRSPNAPDEQEKPGLSHPVALTRWGQDLQELQHQLEERMNKLPSRNRKSSLKKLAADGALTSPSPSSMMLHDIEAHLKQLGCPEASSGAAKTASKECRELLEAKASIGDDVQAKSSPKSLEPPSDVEDEAHFVARMELLEKEEELKEKLDDLSAQNLAWRTQFADKANDLHKELCESPERRELPSCVKFLALLEAERNHRAESQKSNNVPQPEATVPAVVTPEEVKVEAIELHWTDVKDWAKARKLRGGRGRGKITAAPASLIAPATLQGAHWGGRIPRVACVTAFHSSYSDILSIKAFIEHFHKQTYEGPFDLVFVHHKDDQAAADMLAMHTDGTHIKAVVSLGDANDFPSTTDLRYGAWRAEDADVIAHWPYQDEHPNNRLSLQVRALAYAKRPASILRLPADFFDNNDNNNGGEAKEEEAAGNSNDNNNNNDNANGNEVDKSKSKEEAAAVTDEGIDAEAEAAELLEETLLGEAHWMREHWHPLLPEQLAVLQARLQRDVAEVDLTA